MSPSIDNDKVKGYLDYLDKEMTIMGILSSFCIGTLVLVINNFVLAGKDATPNNYWVHHFPYLLIALICLLTAALVFYRQRSLLALYFGQISLYLAKSELSQVSNQLDLADSWSTWNWYKAGFGLLSIAFIEIFFTLVDERIHFIEFIHQWLPYFIPVIITCILGPYIYVCHKYPLADNPWKALRGKK